MAVKQEPRLPLHTDTSTVTTRRSFDLESQQADENDVLTSFVDEDFYSALEAINSERDELFGITQDTEETMPELTDDLLTHYVGEVGVTGFAERVCRVLKKHGYIFVGEGTLIHITSGNVIRF
jgi:hypothetical protein